MRAPSTSPRPRLVRCDFFTILFVVDRQRVEEKTAAGRRAAGRRAAQGGMCRGARAAREARALVFLGARAARDTAAPQRRQAVGWKDGGETRGGEASGPGLG